MRTFYRIVTINQNTIERAKKEFFERGGTITTFPPQIEPHYSIVYLKDIQNDYENITEIYNKPLNQF